MLKVFFADAGDLDQLRTTLDRIEGRRLVFTLSVSESAGLVAAGKLIRVVVDRKSFLANAR